VPPPHAPPARATARRGSAMAGRRRERARIARVFPGRRTVHARSQVRPAPRGPATSTSPTVRAR
jgi:hypothetical protein